MPERIAHRTPLTTCLASLVELRRGFTVQASLMSRNSISWILDMRA